MRYVERALCLLACIVGHTAGEIGLYRLIGAWVLGSILADLWKAYKASKS